jgi:hypothetical protein
MPPANQVVLRNHHAGDRAEEDRVGAEVGREMVAIRQELPRLDGEADDRRKISSAADVLRRIPSARHAEIQREEADAR